MQHVIANNAYCQLLADLNTIKVIIYTDSSITRPPSNNEATSHQIFIALSLNIYIQIIYNATDSQNGPVSPERDISIII